MNAEKSTRRQAYKSENNNFCYKYLNLDQIESYFCLYDAIAKSRKAGNDSLTFHQSRHTYAWLVFLAWNLASQVSTFDTLFLVCPSYLFQEH